MIAEYAFSLFVERKKAGLAGKFATVEDAAWQATEIRLRPYAKQGLELTREFDADERREVDEISSRLSRFFTQPNRQLLLRPRFAGCGFVDSSEGDVIFGGTLFEVKTVERLFRSSDIRQTITYAALNLASSQFAVNNVGLFNPRRGLFCDINLEQVCSEISGRPGPQLLALVIQAISSGEISR